MNLLKLTWLFVAVIAVAEIAGFFILRQVKDTGSVWQYLQQYMLVPLCINVAILLLVHLASLRLLSVGQESEQAVVYFTGVVLICTTLVWMHDTVPTVQAVFCLPLLAAPAYNDKRILRYVYLLCTGMYAFYLLVLSVQPDPIAAMVILLVLLAQFLVANSLVVRQQMLVDSLQVKRKMSMLDEQTQLLNRTALDEHLGEWIRQSTQTGTDLCLLAVDIDDFQKYNQEHGVQAADALVQVCARALLASVGRSDESFRYAGAEFAVLAMRGQEDALRLAEDIRTRFAQGAEGVTLSVGIARYDYKQFSGQAAFIAAADEALNAAKAAGKNCSITWPPIVHTNRMGTRQTV